MHMCVVCGCECVHRRGCACVGASARSRVKVQVRRQIVESGPAWVAGISTNPGREEEGWGMEISQLDPRLETTSIRNQDTQVGPCRQPPPSLPWTGSGRESGIGGGQYFGFTRKSPWGLLLPLPVPHLARLILQALCSERNGKNDSCPAPPCTQATDG